MWVSLLVATGAWLLVGTGLAGAAAAKPKLSIRSVETAPSTPSPGQAFAVAGTIKNSARSRVNALVRVLLGAGGPVLGERRVKLPGRGRGAFALQATLLEGISPGAYSIHVCVVRRGGGHGPCRAARAALTVPGATGGGSTPSGGGGPPGGATPGPDPTPGARTLGDPLFPEVGNGGYDVQSYDVELRWTNAGGDMFLPGTATTVTAQATQALSELSLDLEGLTVSAVEVDGAPATFARVAPVACSSATPPAPCPPTKLVITPASPIADGATFTIEVAYTGDPQRHTDPDGTDEGWADTSDGAFVVNEPIGAMTWMPCNNHPADKASYDFELTVPTGKTALGNGELASPPEDNGDGTTTWRWSSADPLSTYLSTATVGDFDFTQSATPQGLPIYNFIHSAFSPAQKTAAGLITGMQPEMVEYFSVLYGTYPFDSTGTVVDSSDVGYALEVQTKAHFPSATVAPTTLAHEIAHQWFGDSVTLVTWKDIWLNEGWATWSEWIWDNEENGNPLTPAQQFDTEYANPANDYSDPPADPSAAGLFSTFPSYTRPAMMLQALREIIGDGRFFSLARTWHAQHRHSNGNTAQFIALAKEESGFSGANLAKLDTFFQQWLFGTTKPTITGDNFF